MIHIGQLKIPVEKVMAEASKQDLKKGIISAGETAVIKRYIEKKLKNKQSEHKRIYDGSKNRWMREKKNRYFLSIRLIFLQTMKKGS